MQLSEFNFNLPEELIAQYPCKDRTSCRLLTLDGNTGKTQDLKFYQVNEFFSPGDLLVLNNTKVIPARIFGIKETGGKIEILIERIYSNDHILAHIRSSKAPKAGAILLVDVYRFEVLDRKDDLFVLKLNNSDESIFDILDRIGHIPLPPYITRADNEQDQQDYQTVYGKIPGAVAAPTAGLHFDEAYLEKIKSQGVNIAYITLHVGAGTFQPVKVNNIEEHRMHAEYVDLPQEVVDQIKETKRNGKKIIAVGTTSIRALESAANEFGSLENMQAYKKDTSIFIYPGFKYKVVDALITNFHLPQSTLIMLVSAFAGYENTMNAYKHAVEERYRFFSYGDAMYITRKTN